MWQVPSPETDPIYLKTLTRWLRHKILKNICRIEGYVKFIKEEPYHTSIAGKALHDMKRILPDGSAMVHAYETLDDHLQRG